MSIPMSAGAAPADVLVRCEQLVIGYRGHALLPPFDLAIGRGRFVLVAGQNGSGKSTWLRTILGLIPPVKGRLRMAAPLPRLTYVPQNVALDELLPVRAGTVVGWGRLRGWSFLRPFAGRADRQARRAAMADAGAAELAGQRFRDLSGGQRQRVLIARLLAGDADLALLDEPTASMDMASERKTYRRLAELARERDMAVVVVTHTVGAAAEHADEVVFMHRGDGHGASAVVHGAPAEVLAHPLFKSHFGEVEHGG